MREKIKILLLGGGGREHAIAHFLLRSEMTDELHAAPGSDAMIGAVRHMIDPCDSGAVVSLCKSLGVGLVVCGPEAPLVARVGDAVRAAGIPFFGPSGDAAMLEGSKVFAKTFMERHGIPTAKFDVCETLDQCRAAIARRSAPYVIKADGLAAGKGVYLPDDPCEAERICADMIEGRSLGDAGARIVIEDFTAGSELSVFAVTDGTRSIILPPARDHKRALDGDRGPNTGGMGAFAPVTIPDGYLSLVRERVLAPTLAGLREEGRLYRGVLYMGLMITESGPSVIEYNARFGDPETQAVLPLVDGDLGAMMLDAANGCLERDETISDSRSALCVVAASGGYPGKYATGAVISGLDGEEDGSMIFHSGTKRVGGGYVTSGGRVLTVVGVGSTFAEAKSRAYGRIGRISFDGMHYRKDIGWSEER